MRVLRLTQLNGEPIWVNYHAMISMQLDQRANHRDVTVVGFTKICVGLGTYIEVKELPQDIMVLNIAGT